MSDEDRLLGSFEEIVLRTVALLGRTGYGVTIHRKVEEAVRRRVSFGAIYATLDRLERKGYVDSELGEATPERGGRPKRYYWIEGAGVVALDRIEQVRRQLTPAPDPGV